jgi:hypothetical protein
MKLLKFFLYAFCILLFSCKDPDIESFTMEIGKIDRIELIDETDVSFVSRESAKIGLLVSFLLRGGKDQAGRDFTTHDFIKFYGANGKTVQVEIFKSLFKTKGTVFVAESNVIKKMRAIFDNNPLIETVEPAVK